MEFSELYMETQIDAVLADVTDELYPRDISKGVELNNRDFNLNSPLISDEIEQLEIYLKSRSSYIPRRFSQRREEWIKFKNVLQGKKIDILSIKGHEHHHRKIPELIYNNPLKYIGFSILVSRWKSMFIKSDYITSLHHKLGSDYIPEFFNILLSKDKLMKEFKSFVSYYFLIILMNKSFKDLEESSSELFFPCCELIPNVKSNISSNPILVIGNMDHPIWTISPYYAYNHMHKMLFDRNFILLLKDISLARFSSRISLLMDSILTDSLDGYSTIDSLYTEGDEILSKDGNFCYEKIKLLEAECTQRWIELSHVYRPLIPKSDRLRGHLDKSIDLLNSSNLSFHNCSSFFNLIRELTDPQTIATVYGSFRHWGHPYIDYMEGLRKLEERVNSECEIDKHYSELLASDFAFLIVKKHFHSHKRWPIDLSLLETDHIFYDSILDQVWPTNQLIIDFGDEWHNLPISKCMNIPEMLDTSVLYADKSHSMTRSEIKEWVSNHPDEPIPSKKVMDTLLKSEDVNIIEFLTKVNNYGLEEDDLVIGLKAKERELKKDGRYFSLMSWNMRLYFVITEYLIKEKFIPVFKGITMADDLQSMTKKLLTATEGQGLNSYDKIYIANELDYDKWNNRQRYESTEHVFRVMGKCFGLPELFSYTHLLFQRSWIYYNDRADLISVDENRLSNKYTDKTVCWNGQKGGLEGLRQKGWTIVGYLILRRESLSRNTKTTFLAQGDNQVIITQYEVKGVRSIEELENRLRSVWVNNEGIMHRIEKGSMKLNLLINHDEVATSADFLMYGKLPIFRGRFLSSEIKRWARISAVTNDQIPTLANSLSSVSTSALTVCQHSNSLDGPIIKYGLYGSLILSIQSLYNILRGSDPFNYKTLSSNNLTSLVIRALYKDPSVGGISGTCLSRFVIRGFPDPVSESLSWWRWVHFRTKSDLIKKLCIEAGNPKLGGVDAISFSKLLEKPNSLNIPGSLSIETLIKDEVRKQLEDSIDKIRNESVRHAIIHGKVEGPNFISSLMNVRPMFPRFLSELYASSFLKLSDNIVGLFQNSRTIRRYFSKRFSSKVQSIMQISEFMSIKLILTPRRGSLSNCIWECSSEHSDLLREISWGSPVVGTTIPHPVELLTEALNCENHCDPRLHPDHITVKLDGLSYLNTWSRGSIQPYLGSRTSETTSIYQPWEKEIELPLIRRAVALRRAIGWFIEENSIPGKMIFDNLFALTGIDMSETISDTLRTGSALHRFYCSRQSSIGQPGISPNRLKFCMVTADQLNIINHENYDFMYQTLLIYSEVMAMVIKDPISCYHFHIKCLKCIRPIKEIKLTSDISYEFENVSDIIKRMLTCDIRVDKKMPIVFRTTGEWNELSPDHKSFHIGKSQGFLWSMKVYGNNEEFGIGGIFPFVIWKKVYPIPYLKGLLSGMMNGSVLNSTTRRYSTTTDEAQNVLRGSTWYVVEQWIKKVNIEGLMTLASFQSGLRDVFKFNVKTYPASREEIGSPLKKFLLEELDLVLTRKRSISLGSLWIFADMRSEYLCGMFQVTEKMKEAFHSVNMSSSGRSNLSHGKAILGFIEQRENNELSDDQQKALKKRLEHHSWPVVKVVNKEARHAILDIEELRIDYSFQFSNRVDLYCGDCIKGHIDFLTKSQKSNKEENSHNLSLVPRIRNPLAAGSRLIQLSTGGHYKLTSLIREYDIKGDGMLIGDGSGGMSVMYLLTLPSSRIIFNSLFSCPLDGGSGVSPGIPGAFMFVPLEIQNRCVNLRTAWEESSDLSKSETWDYFEKLVIEYNLNIKTIICDAEVDEEQTSDLIESLILSRSFKIFGKKNKKNNRLIYKTYVNRILKNQHFIDSLLNSYNEVEYCYPWAQGSQTSEVYIISTGSKFSGLGYRLSASIYSINEIRQHSPVMRSFESEFKRSLKLSYNVMTSGLTSYIPYSSAIELAIFLNDVGLMSGWCENISEKILESIENNIHPLFLVYLIGGLLGELIIPVTKWSDAGVQVASTSSCSKYISILYGLWYGCSLVCKSSSSCKIVNLRYQNDPFISFGVIDDPNSNLHSYTIWGFCKKSVFKKIPLGHKMYVVQRMIRMMLILYKGRHIERSMTKKEESYTDQCLQKWYKKLTVRILHERTGVSYNKEVTDWREPECDQFIDQEYIESDAEEEYNAEDI